MRKFFSLITALVLCTAMWGGEPKVSQTLYKVEGALYQGLNEKFTGGKNIFVPNDSAVVFTSFDGQPADWYRNNSLQEGGEGTPSFKFQKSFNDYAPIQIRNYTGYGQNATKTKIDYIYGKAAYNGTTLSVGTSTMNMMSMANGYYYRTEDSATTSNIGLCYIDNMTASGAESYKTKYGTYMTYGTKFTYEKYGGLVDAYEMLLDNPGEMYIDYVILPIFGYPKTAETTIEKMIPDGKTVTLKLYPLSTISKDADGKYSYKKESAPVATMTVNNKAYTKDVSKAENGYRGTLKFVLDEPILMTKSFVAELTWDDGCDFGLITDNYNLQNYTTWYIWKNAKYFFWSGGGHNVSISYHATFPTLDKKDTKTAFNFASTGGSDNIAFRSNIDPAKTEDFTIDFGGAEWISMTGITYSAGTYKKSGTNTLTFAVEANEGEAREATITLKHHGKVLTYTVSQEAAPAPVEPTNLYLKAGEVDYMKDGAVVYLYSWGGSSDADWSKFELIENETTAKASMMLDRTGLKIVRFASGTTTPSWQGTIWNQTGDISVSSDFPEKVDMIELSAWSDATAATWSKYVKPEVKYYLKNNWNNGEWSWKEMKLDEEVYVLDRVVFGGTGVNLNTAKSDEGSKWFDLKSLKYNDEDTIQALDTVRFELAISEKDTVLTAIVLARPTPPCTPNFGVMVDDTVYQKGTFNETDNQWEVKGVSLAEDQALTLYNLCEETAFMPKAGNFGEVFEVDAKAMIVKETAIYDFYIKLIADADELWVVKHNVEVLPQITEAPKSWAGEYVITAMKDENTALVWTGVDAGQCRVETPVVEGEVTMTDPVKVIVEAMNGGGYSIKVKGGTNDGKYMTQKATPAYGNALSFVDSPVRVDIEMNKDGLVDIYQTINATQKVYLLYNAQAGTTNERFRFYKDSNYGGANYKSLTLFGTVAPVMNYDTTMYVAGNFTDWQNEMIELPAKVDFPADSTLEFKQVRVITTTDEGGKVVKQDTTWYGQAGEGNFMTRESNAWLLDGTNNVFAKTDVEGTYTFSINEKGEFVITWPITYYLKNNWNNGEWSWKEMKADEEGYVLDSVVFGGTGVNLNTAKSDEGSKWFDLKSLKYNEQDTIQALDTVRFELAISEKDTVLTAILLGRPAPAARKEFVFVAGEAAEANPAMFAITWGKDGSNETVKMTQKGEEALYTANILETVDSLVLVRCASDATEIIWDGEGKNVWNQTANYALCDTMYFESWVEETNLFAVTCEAPKPVETKYYAKNNWNGAAADDWSWLEMSATDQENVYMLDSVVFGGTGVNINTKEDDTDAKWFAADAITVLNDVVGFVPPTPKPKTGDTVLWAPAHSGIVLEAPQLQSGDTIKLFFNAADSTLKAFIVGRPAPAPRKEFTFIAGEAADSDPAMFAITWGKDGSNETVKLANKADDIYTAEILETVDSLVLVRCATGATEIIWDGEGKNVWNQTANYALCDTMYFGGWTEEGLITLTCEAPQPVETKYYAKNNWNGATEWSWLEMSATDQENFYMLDSVVFGGTGININSKEDDTDAKWFDIDAITVLDDLDGLPGPIPPDPRKRDTIPYAPAHSGVVLEAPQLLAGDTIKLFFNAADSTLKAFIVGRPAPAPRKEFVFVAGEAADSDPAMFAITWGKDGSNETVKLANKADDIYTAEILETVDSLVLVRCATGATEIIWDGEGKNVWNQTANYALCDTMYFGGWTEEGLITLTCEAPKPVEVKYYVTGNAALVGEEKAWQADAIEMVDYTHTFPMLAAGEYQLKVTDGTWEHAWGYDNLSPTVAVEGLYTDVDGNICFTVYTPNDVTVTFAQGYVVVTGDFKNPTPATPDFGLLVNGTDYLPGTPEDKDTYTEYAVNTQLAIGEFVQLYDNVNKAAWTVTPEGSGFTDFEMKNDAYYIKQAGLYQFYIKIPKEGMESGLYVGFQASGTNLNNLKAQDGKRYNILGQPVNETYRGIVIMNGQTYLQ